MNESLPRPLLRRGEYSESGFTGWKDN